MNFAEFEAEVEKRSNGRAYSVNVQKLVHGDRKHRDFKWLVWVADILRMATGSTPQAALDDLDCLMQAPAHTEQVIDPMDPTEEPRVVVDPFESGDEQPSADVLHPV